jgi:hypothetical protein
VSRRSGSLRISVAVAGVALCAATSVAVAAPPAGASPRVTPTFTVSPESGPVGTRVHFDGNVDASQIDLYRNAAGQGLWGSAPPDCAILVDFKQFHIDVADDGHATGSFVVGDSLSGCNMNTEATPPSTVPAVTYTVTLVAHCCPEAQFRITAGEALARTGASDLPLLLLGLALIALGLFFISTAHKRGAMSTR